MENSKGSVLRVVVLGVGVVLFGLLMFADKTNLNNPDRELKTSGRGIQEAGGSDLIKAELPPLAKDETLDGWIQGLNEKPNEEKSVLLDSIITRLESRKRYGHAAKFASQLAMQTSSLPDLFRAGRLHQQAARLDYIARDTVLAAQYNEKAVQYLTQVTEADSTQADALYYLGVAQVESGTLPMDRMQGVLKVRKVLSIDPNHIEANYTLGVFSVQTQQFDKAEGRFEKVLSLQPDNYTAQYFLALARIKQNKQSGTKEMLEEVLKKSPDPELKRTVRNLINETF